MRILVTGGAGFIGSHIAESLVAGGHQVLVLDNLSTGKVENIPQGCQFFKGDIADEDRVEEIISDFKPEAICHQAAQASVVVSVRSPEDDLRTNTLGTLNLLQAAKRHGVSRFVYASTGGALYGEVPEGTSAKIDTLPLPKSPYACSKLAGEYYVRAAGREQDLQTVVLRYGNVYGPRQDPHGEAGVVAIFANRLSVNQSIKIYARTKSGDDGCVRDYVYVEDVVRANIAALSGEISQDVMNVGTGVGTTTAQLATLISEALEKTAEIAPAPPRAGDLERSVLDIQPFIAHFGNVTPLWEGIQKSAAWFYQQIHDAA